MSPNISSISSVLQYSKSRSKTYPFFLFDQTTTGHSHISSTASWPINRIASVQKVLLWSSSPGTTFGFCSLLKAFRSQRSGSRNTLSQYLWWDIVLLAAAILPGKLGYFLCFSGLSWKRPFRRSKQSFFSGLKLDSYLKAQLGHQSLYWLIINLVLWHQVLPPLKKMKFFTLRLDY